LSRSTVAAVSCVLGFAAQAAGAVEEEEARGSTHVLVLAAEMLAERELPEASAVAVRMALATPELSSADRARLDLVVAKLHLKGSGTASNAPASAESRAGSLLRLVDALYKELQFDGATAALQLARHCEPVSKGEQAQLVLRQGLLRMESFDEAGARRAFREALDLDGAAQLPNFAPPKTIRLLEEVRGALPSPQSVKAPAPVAGPAPAGLASLRPWAWVPAVGGAALGATGGLLYLGAKARYDFLFSHPESGTPEQFLEAASTGRALQAGAFVLFGVGAAALASAAALAFLGDPNAIQASVQVGPGAVGVAIVGVFP